MGVGPKSNPEKQFSGSKLFFGGWLGVGPTPKKNFLDRLVGAWSEKQARKTNFWVEVVFWGLIGGWSEKQPRKGTFWVEVAFWGLVGGWSEKQPRKTTFWVEVVSYSLELVGF